ncbi:MAG: betaine-aldehyde dehydrogenase [Alphaproteobacteria bacterium]|jgi:betaine-aldehyde dehydrogenase|nr:betaine-aldehyde dehydrogenase [Alphaproteobacteria bacterium]
MTVAALRESATTQASSPLPVHRDLYYGGAWHKPLGGYEPTWNPATGENLGNAANANAADIDAAAQAAHKAFVEWRRIKPTERAALMRKISAVIRANADEFALIDSLNCGNPLWALRRDISNAAASIDFFAGLVLQVQGATIPLGEGIVNMTVREPIGVIGRIVAYNHPFSFAAAKLGSILGAGCTTVIKAAQQAPLSAFRLMELIEGILPPGVVNVVSGGVECGQAMVAHPLIPKISLVGSVPTGRAIARGAADRLKLVELELGGKNALIVYPDADVKRVIAGAVGGMNFAWCGQSCGSMSRLFIHESLHDQVLDGVIEGIRKIKPGNPQDDATKMGALISKAQFDKVMSYIEIGKKEGAKLLTGGKVPDDPKLKGGFFVEPTVFSGVTMDMRIGREEIFGPVLSVFKWSDEEKMFADVNAVEYGLTGAVFTTSLATAHRAAARIEAGYVWVNSAGGQALGTPYGGIKQSGYGRDKVLDEMLSHTVLKNIAITL